MYVVPAAAPLGKTDAFALNLTAPFILPRWPSSSHA